MDYYIINILCNVLLLLVLQRLLGDFLNVEMYKKHLRSIASFLWLVGTLMVNELFHLPVLNLTANFLFTFLIACTYESKVIHKMLVVILITVMSAACDLLAYVITAPVLGEQNYFYSYIFTVIFMLLIERTIGFRLRKGKAWKLIGREMILLSGFPVLAAVALYCVTAMCQGTYQLIAGLAVVGISLLSVFLYNNISQNLDNEWEKEILEKRVDAYKHELETMQDSYRKMQNLRHDLRHHLIEMEGLAQQGKKKELCLYIGELQKQFDNSKRMVYTGEYEIDSLVNYLIEDARNRQVDVQTDIKVPEDMDMSSFKFNVIVGNLLENAIEAAVRSEKKSITLNMRFCGGVMFLQIMNSFTGSINRRGKEIVTSKQDFENHGIGLRSVQDLVKQQGGEINIYTDHDIFHVEVMMTIR